MVTLAAAALFAMAAVRERDHPWAAGAWAMLAGAHAIVTLYPLGRSPDGFVSLYAVLVLIPAWLLLRATVPRWRSGLWADALTVFFGALALGLTGLSWRSDGGPHRAPVIAVVLASAVLGICALAAWRPRRVAGWLSAGLVVLAVAQALDARLLSLVGYVVVALSAKPLAPTVPTTDRRRVTVRGRPIGDVPSLAIVTSVVLLGLRLAGVKVAGRPGISLGSVAALAALCIAVARPGGGWRRLTGPDRDTDELTGLANRKALAQALASDGAAPHVLDQSAGEPWSGWTDQIAMLLVDLDRFKEVNEAHGHAVGDQVLAQVGSRLRSVLRPHQLLARLGGDEFAVVLPGAGPEPARRVAEALRAQLEDPVDVEAASGTQHVYVRASVGIATCRLPRGNPQDLLRQADVAVYEAKVSGSGIEQFDAEHDRRGAQRLRRIGELRSALEHGDLEVYLQPQVDLASGRLCGAEALARWRHPKDGVLLPAAFLPLAAQTGLMRPVASLVLDLALSACAKWWPTDQHIPVSVNLTGDDLVDPDLTRRVPETLARHGLPPSALRIEITEDVLLSDTARVSRLLETWRGIGIAIALDDYGTGYSSLAHLRELPIDELKLDRVFVADLANRRTATIVRHTVYMAHGLGMRVVAEGVEGQVTARTLAAVGCDVGQGLYFGAAMDLPAFLTHLRAQPT